MNLKKQPPKGDKTMKQLTKQQRELLAITPDSQLLKVFPGFTREYLREEKRKCKKATPEETIDRDRKALISKLNEAELSKKYKSSLPAVTFCGTFKEKRNLESCVHYNNVMVIDIDHIDDNIAKFESKLN